MSCGAIRKVVKVGFDVVTTAIDVSGLQFIHRLVNEIHAIMNESFELFLLVYPIQSYVRIRQLMNRMHSYR